MEYYSFTKLALCQLIFVCSVHMCNWFAFRCIPLCFECKYSRHHLFNSSQDLSGEKLQNFMGKWASIQGHWLLETVVTLEKGSTQRIELTASNDCTGSFTLALTRNLPDRSGMEETDRQSTVCGQHHHFLPAVLTMIYPMTMQILILLHRAFDLLGGAFAVVCRFISNAITHTIIFSSRIRTYHSRSCNENEWEKRLQINERLPLCSTVSVARFQRLDRLILLLY